MNFGALVYMSRKTGLLGIVLVLLLSQQIQKSVADQIPGTNFRGPKYYVSTDIKPISIEFVPRPWQNESGYPEKITISLPRAYVNYVGGYSSVPAKTSDERTPKSRLRGWEQLPDIVLTDQIIVSLAQPDGGPYTVDGARLSPNLNREGVSQRREVAQFARITLSRALEKDQENYWLGQAKNKNKTLLNVDGLLYRLVPRDGYYHRHYYHNAGFGALEYVICMRGPKQFRPGSYCTYNVRLGDNFLAEIQFLDFRMHGGRSFIIERIGVFLEAMCQYFPCGEEDLLVLSD